MKHPGRKVEQPVQNLSLKFAGENEDEAGANTTGIAVKFLVDLQRFMMFRSNAKLRTTGLLLAKGVGVVQFYFCLLLPDPYKQIPILG